MYANLSCALALQKLFKTFISSSSGHCGDLETKLIAPHKIMKILFAIAARPKPWTIYRAIMTDAPKR